MVNSFNCTKLRVKTGNIGWNRDENQRDVPKAACLYSKRRGEVLAITIVKFWVVKARHYSNRACFKLNEKNKDSSLLLNRSSITFTKATNALQNEVNFSYETFGSSVIQRPGSGIIRHIVSTFYQAMKVIKPVEEGKNESWPKGSKIQITFY